MDEVLLQTLDRADQIGQIVVAVFVELIEIAYHRVHFAFHIVDWLHFERPLGRNRPAPDCSLRIRWWRSASRFSWIHQQVSIGRRSVRCLALLV